jgi:hypothetical protein
MISSRDGVLLSPPTVNSSKRGRAENPEPGVENDSSFATSQLRKVKQVKGVRRVGSMVPAFALEIL